VIETRNMLCTYGSTLTADEPGDSIVALYISFIMFISRGIIIIRVIIVPCMEITCGPCDVTGHQLLLMIGQYFSLVHKKGLNLQENC
jgi:hypothetical protein